MFLGPVAGSVRNEWSREEIRRSVCKGVAAAIASGWSLWATATSPEVLSLVVAPTVIAILVGLMDALSRYGQSAPPLLPPLPPGTIYPSPEPPPLQADPNQPPGTAGAKPAGESWHE